MIEKNPCTYATVPKHKLQKREIWTAETLMYAMDVCEDERLKLAINLSFSCSLRLGELLGLTWDCVDISPEAIEENRAYVYINKETQRVKKESLKDLEGKDVLLVFPSQHKTNTTVQILKTPKTESSIRKVFLPKSVANMLVEWKAEQDEVKEVLGEEYIDYNLVMATTFGNPIGTGAIRGQLKKLIEEHNLPPVVFHSLRHSSVTYKLKLNGGDIKAVQGDSGHSQVDMVTDIYSHIIDEDRRRNAELFEEAFYEKKNLDPKMREETTTQTVDVPDDVDAELLAKVLANPGNESTIGFVGKGDEVMKNSEILVENSMCRIFSKLKYKTKRFYPTMKVSSKMGYNMDERTKEWMINLRKVGVGVRKFDYMKLAMGVGWRSRHICKNS